MMRKPSLILACLTLLGGALSPLYGSAEGDEDAITGVTINGHSALHVLYQGVLKPIYDLSRNGDHVVHIGEEMSHPYVKNFVGFEIAVLASHNKGIHVSSKSVDGKFNVTFSNNSSPLKYYEAPMDICYDMLVELNIKSEYLAGINPSIYTGGKFISFINPSGSYSGTNLVSNGPIDIMAQHLKFNTILARTPTGLFLAPHPDMPAPFITGITVYPKIFYYTQDGEIHQSRTMCLEGTVDFQRGVFDLVCCDVEKIDVKFSKAVLKSIQRDALLSHGLTPAPSLTSTQMSEAVYALALAYRDGKEGHPKDASKAKALFTQYIEMFADPAGAPFPELYGKAHHNLGTLAYNAGDFSMAAKHYALAAGEGFEASNRNLLSLYIHEQIPATPKERFLAICDYHGYSLPMERAAFRFDYHAPNADGRNSSDMEAGLGMCFKTMQNTAPGVLRAPVIWITQPDGLTGDGRIESHLLVVGQTRIPLTS